MARLRSLVCFFFSALDPLFIPYFHPLLSNINLKAIVRGTCPVLFCVLFKLYCMSVPLDLVDVHSKCIICEVCKAFVTGTDAKKNFHLYTCLKKLKSAKGLHPLKNCFNCHLPFEPTFELCPREQKGFFFIAVGLHCRECAGEVNEILINFSQLSFVDSREGGERERIRGRKVGGTCKTAATLL